MIEGRNIICFANDWHSDPTSKHQIMRLLSKRNRVLWVNSIGLRKPGLGGRDFKRITGKLRSFSRGAERIHDNLYVFTPVVIPFHGSSTARWINTALLKNALSRYIMKLGMKDILYWSYLPNVGYIIGQMSPELIVYHCVDEWSKFSFIDDDIIHKEHELCAMADLVLASARSLYESRKPYNENTHYVSHGVDYDYFHGGRTSDIPLPMDMEGVGSPIAGFFGLIHEWIDLDLLEYIISNNASVSFVFIGECSVDVRHLAEYGNAHFLGQKKYSDLIAYARHFDVGLIPFKVNELTVNVNPIKLKEYLALGIPVVSVDLPEISYYRRVVRIAGNRENFDMALKEELSGRHIASAEEIDSVATKETWRQKVEDISKLIELTESTSRPNRNPG
jgi:glycosyltransferase involved in cell wall biosynthesis